MKTRLSLFFIIVLTAAATHPFLARSTRPQAPNPPYLSQFPSVERVKAEIKGSDPIDTSARQVGALWQFVEMIKTLAGPRFQSNEFTPDEDRVKGQYFNAWQRFLYKENEPPAQDRPRWYKLREFYENDPGFRDELLQRFFSPQFRTGYYRFTGKQQPQKASVESNQPVVTKSSSANTGSGPAKGSGAGTSRPGTGAAPGTADYYLSEGYKYRDAKDYARAIESLKKGVALNQSSGDGYFNLGYCYYLLEQYQNALPAFQKAVRLKPDNDSTHFWLGRTYYLLEQYQSALTALQQAVRLKVDDPYRHHWLGEAYANGFKQYEKAVAEYRETIRLQPDYAVAHNQLGLSYFQLDQLDEALAAYKEAVRLKPAEGLYHLNMGQIYVEMGMKEQALEVQRTLLRVDATKAKTLADYILASFPVQFEDDKLLSYAVILGDENPGAALKLYRRAILLKPIPEELARAHCGLGDAYKKLNKHSTATASYQQAIRIYQRLIPLNPQKPHLQYFLGHSYLGLGQKAQALQVQKRLATVDQKYAKELLNEINKSP